MNSTDLSGESNKSPSDPNSPETESQSVVKSVQQVADELGPFVPPYDFDHGEEFLPDVIRPLPKFVRKGSFHHRRQSVSIVLAALGSSFIIFAPWRIVQNLSFYVLPLAYLSYVGYGLILWSFCLAIRNRVSRRRFEYIQSGTPFVGRVLSVRHHVTETPVGHGQTLRRFRFGVILEYDNPETGLHEFGEDIIDDTWDLSQLPNYAITVEPGDYVTVVGLPGRISETLKVYGGLGLNPGQEFLTYRGKPLTGTSPLTAVMYATLVFIALWAVIGLLYLIAFIPSEWNWSVGLAFVGAGVVVGTIGGGILARSAARKASDQNSPAVALIGCGFAGAFGGVMVMSLINALFDNSAPIYRSISINNHWQTTHNFIIRTYEIEYTDFGQPNSQKMQVTVEDLVRIGPNTLAAKDIREGALGLEWISGVHPCEWHPISDTPTALDEQRSITVDAKKWLQAILKRMQMNIGPAELTLMDAEDGKQMTLVPVLVLRDGTFAPVPEELVDPAKQQLMNELN